MRHLEVKDFFLHFFYGLRWVFSNACHLTAMGSARSRFNLAKTYILASNPLSPKIYSKMVPTLTNRRLCLQMAENPL